MGGLSVARVLADHADRVTIIERDALDHTSPKIRGGMSAVVPSLVTLSLSSPFLFDLFSSTLSSSAIISRYGVLVSDSFPD